MDQRKELALILQALQTDASHANELVIDPSINWTAFYLLTIRHRVWHQMQHIIFCHERYSSIPMAKQLANYCQNDKLRLLSTAMEVTRIAQVFNHDNIQYCVIKGPILNVLLYGALDTRPCRDIDIWVSLNDFQDAMSKLISLGYQKKLPNYELNGFKERYYMAHKHDMAFYHPERKLLVELHFRLSYFGINFFVPNTPMLKTIDLFNTPISTLHDDYHLLYLMIHGSIHAWMRLRWLNDIALFVKSNRCNLQNVMNLSKKIHCEHIVQQSLMLIHDLFNVNDDVLCQLIQKPSRRALTLTALGKQFIAEDYVMTDGIRNIKMFVKYRYYLVRLAVKRQKMNAICSDLFKIDELFQSITLPDKLSFMYYVLYVGWVIKFVLRSRRTV